MYVFLIEDTVILLQSIATTTHEVSIQVEADTLEPIELQEAQRTLLQHMVASHKLSAERMIATLTCKVEVLKRLIP